MKNFIKWLCIVIIVLSPGMKYIKGCVKTMQIYIPHKIELNNYFPVNLQIEDDRISFQILNLNSFIGYTHYQFKIVDRELIITLYARHFDSSIFDRLFPHTIKSVNISIRTDQYDKILLSDGQNTELIYENGIFKYEDFLPPDAPVPEFLGTYN